MSVFQSFRNSCSSWKRGEVTCFSSSARRLSRDRYRSRTSLTDGPAGAAVRSLVTCDSRALRDRLDRLDVLIPQQLRVSVTIPWPRCDAAGIRQTAARYAKTAKGIAIRNAINARKRVTFRLSPKYPASPAHTPPRTARSASRYRRYSDVSLYEVMSASNGLGGRFARNHFLFYVPNIPAVFP